MAMEMMTVETKERRNIRMTRKARTEPTDASCQRLWIDWRMYVDWSKVRLTWTPEGTPEETREGALDRVHHLDRVGAGLLVHPHVDGALAVHTHDRLLRLRGVLHTAEVAHADRLAVDAPDDDVLHRLDDRELVVGEDVVVERAELDVSGGQEEVRVVDGAGHLGDGDPLRVEQVAVQVDGDLADLSAVHVGRGHAGQPLELGLDGVVGEVVELLLVEAAARQRHQAHRDVGEIELEDERLLDTGRQRVHDLLDPLHDLGQARVQIGAPREEHLDHGDALSRAGFDVAHVRDGGHGLLDRVGDGPLDVLDVGALVDGADPDRRVVDVGEEVDRHAAEGGRTEDHDGQRRHEDGDAVAHGEEREPHTRLGRSARVVQARFDQGSPRAHAAVVMMSSPERCGPSASA